MYLKSIEVQGFKSFAHKIIFEFHNGITGIVGPNGSGKSNVADAVRWVLGEQSAKQLRGAKMEDVIFSGTENRKPQGFAYVALTIENSDHKLAIDYDEVTVARRVYRSGESEYLINSAPCRLKDVHELFYDTGIGKEGYSIIGQGQIDKILSGKPEERRELFDEAAGIVKYKRRKNEASKKLENERQNLVRIKDILSELEKQVGPLERQMETAKKYLQLKEELKVYDINMFLLETTSLKEQIKEQEAKIRLVREDLEQSGKAHEKAKEDCQKAEQQLEEVMAAMEGTNAEISGLQMEKGRLENEIRLLEEQINSAKTQEENLKLRMLALQKEMDGFLKEEETHQAEKSEMDKLLLKTEKERLEAEEKLSSILLQIQASGQSIENRRGRIIELLNEKSNIKTKMQRYDTMLEQSQIRKAELNRKLLQYKSSETAQSEGMEALEAELKELGAVIEMAEKKREELNARILALHDINLALEKERNSLQQQFHSERSRLEALQNMTERYEGYGNSIRRVMEQKAKRPGIVGVVADIIKAEKQFETAIETALGGSIQNIVTDNETTAKEMIEYLKKNKFGRATFLPITGIGNRNLFQNEKVLKEDGVFGLASDLVLVDKKYEGIARYLLGRVVVADHIDNALRLAKKYDYSLRIVTLEGELLNAGGSMTGGAFKNAGNLLGRRREIEELKQRVETLSQDWKKADLQIVENRAENTENRSRLEEMKKEIQEQYIFRNTKNLNKEHMEREMSALKDEFDDVIKESKELDKQALEIKEELNALKEELNASEEEATRLEKEIGELNLQTEEKKLSEQKQSRITEEIRMEYANCSQRAEFIKENLLRVRREAGRRREEMKSLKHTTEDANGSIEQKKQKIQELTEETGRTQEKILDREKSLVVHNASRDKLTLFRKKSFEQREELSERLSMLDKETYRLEGQIEKWNDMLDSSVHYIWEEYQLTPSEAEAYKNPLYSDVSEMKKMTSALKGNIKALGSVNVNAIEEYKEVSERYEFLKTQHDDLITAEETLMKIIEELDTGMRVQFEEKFQEIKAEFDKVFKELFGGGKGTLELVENEDVLEAGIRIISQPPGKKLQNMMQLSGGEKALTAIALLFAIQNLKPSPFCLLDEIEAALDDSNVGRFAQYLHKLTKHTQFIVITHRRGTMSAADRLYGITMQEKGISTLVSVNLIENDLDEPPKQAG